jgi:hypothetical protein
MTTRTSATMREVRFQAYQLLSRLSTLCYSGIVLHQMFGVADTLDVALMAIGSCGSLVIGLSNPAFNVLFGEMIDTLNRGSMTFTELVAQLCIVLVIIACVNVFAGFLQVFVILSLHAILQRPLICSCVGSLNRYIAGHTLVKGKPRNSARSTSTRFSLKTLDGLTVVVRESCLRGSPNLAARFNTAWAASSATQCSSPHRSWGVMLRRSTSRGVWRQYSSPLFRSSLELVSAAM